jgi:hypothetical protein
MAAPSITVQPKTQRFKIGETLLLSVVASETAPLSYQWQKDGVDISGAVADEYGKSSFSYADEGSYAVTISNGSGTVTSDVAIIKSMPGQLDEEYLQRKIYDWLATVIPLSSIPANRTGKALMVWHMQDVERMPTPLLMGRVSSFQKIGRDAVFNPDNEGSKRQAGVREFMLYLQYFGANALTVLQKISDATEDSASIESLQADGITPVWPEPVIDAHQFLDTMPEDRAILDIRFRTTSEWSTVIEVLESAEATGEVNGETVLVNPS